MGNLALLVSDHLSPSLYGLERIEDLRARAWAYIGNSLRVRVNLAGAEKAFEKAFAHLRRGTGEVLSLIAPFSWSTTPYPGSIFDGSLE